jgi:hypothetical protein
VRANDDELVFFYCGGRCRAAGRHCRACCLVVFFAHRPLPTATLSVHVCVCVYTALSVLLIRSVGAVYVQVWVAMMVERKSKNKVGVVVKSARGWM